MRFRIAVTLTSAVLLASSGAAKDEWPAPLAIYGNKHTIEIAPVLVASAIAYAHLDNIHMGGIPNLVGEPGTPDSEAGEADLATNAETQLLRQSVKHPDLRIVAGVSEGLYRIVARRSAGIARVADLRGKRVATIEQTSSGYFLDRMLRRAGLTFDDIQAKPFVPLSGMTEALKKGEVDAVVIWEPEALHAEQALGPDVIEFTGEGVYRELFNLNTTAGKLADPVMRARIVGFVRALINARDNIRKDPLGAKILVSQIGGFDPRDVEASWAHHRFVPAMPGDLLDVLVEEEQWLAARDKRPPRGRKELAKLIDSSVYRQAVAMGPYE